MKLAFPYGAFTPSGRTFQYLSGSSLLLNAVHTPWCTHHGLGSSAFARRYLRNHYCFLFLSLLRCFSSGGSRLHTMDSCAVAAGLLQQVSPFRDPRITGYLLLPAAYRSLSRLSSALSAKASTLRSFCLTSSSRAALLLGPASPDLTALRRSSSPPGSSRILPGQCGRNFLRHPWDLNISASVRTCGRSCSLHSNEFMFAHLTVCAFLCGYGSLTTPAGAVGLIRIHLGCLDILISLECFVLYVVFKVRSTMLRMIAFKLA